MAATDEPNAERDRSANDVVFTVPVGADGIQYGGLRGAAAEPEPAQASGEKGPPDPGQPAWGPAALAVAEGPRFFIADTVGQRVLQYDAAGRLLAHIDFADQALAIDDVHVTADELWVLDQAAETPQLLRLPATREAAGAPPTFAPDASAAEKLPLTGVAPVEGIPSATRSADAHDVESIGFGATGIALDDDGVLVEYDHGASVFRPSATRAIPDDTDGGPALEEAPGYRLRGQIYTARPTDLTADGATRNVTVGNRSVPVAGTNGLLGLRLLGANADESFFVVAEEMLPGEMIEVDQTVRHYAADGTLLESARVPLREAAMHVPNNLALGPDGAVYLLQPRTDVVEIQRLRFVPELAPLTPRATATRADVPVADTAFARDTLASEPGFAREESATRATRGADDAGCRSRDAMIELAFRYRDNKCRLTDANINGQCSGRVRPHYIDHGAAEYGSVAYDWGGFDTVEDYNAFMAQGKQAGDMPTSISDPPTPCSKGVDCSGFVSRCWGLTTKQSTSTIHTVSFKIDLRDLRPGDILNMAGSHVTLYHHEDANGVWAFEATAWGNRDRVIYRPHPWSYYDGFHARRFNDVCSD